MTTTKATRILWDEAGCVEHGLKAYRLSRGEENELTEAERVRANELIHAMYNLSDELEAILKKGAYRFNDRMNRGG